MFCKLTKHKWVWHVFLVIGIIALALGILGPKIIQNEQQNLDMLMGMFFGLGIVFTTMGGIKVIKYRRISSEKLKREEIELSDERNIQILRAANSVANASATIIFVIMAFIFVTLNYIVPAFIAIGAMLIQSLILLIAKRQMNKRM